MKYARHKKSPLVYAVVAVLVVLGYFGWRAAAVDNRPVINGPLPKAVVYRSLTCGCCANFVSYLKSKGFEVETKLVETAERLKLGVPNSLGSCHTAQIGGYTVEGHVPVEAFAKLLNEKPAVAGIGMAGMPSGSPGMPGLKNEDFVISSFQEDGSTQEYMRL